MFIDCPKCATEFIMNDTTVRRCPDCLQWIDLDLDATMYAKTYYSNSHQVSSYNNQDELNYAYDY